MTCPVLSQSEIFFFISSIGFIILWIFLIILLFYAIRAMRAFSRIADSAEKDLNRIGENAEEMLEDIRESFIYKMIFGRKKKKQKKNSA